MKNFIIFLALFSIMSFCENSKQQKLSIKTSNNKVITAESIMKVCANALNCYLNVKIKIQNIGCVIFLLHFVYRVILIEINQDNEHSTPSKHIMGPMDAPVNYALNPEANHLNRPSV